MATRSFDLLAKAWAAGKSVTFLNPTDIILQCKGPAALAYTLTKSTALPSVAVDEGMEILPGADKAFTVAAGDVLHLAAVDLTRHAPQTRAVVQSRAASGVPENVDTAMLSPVDLEDGGVDTLDQGGSFVQPNPLFGRTADGYPSDGFVGTLHSVRDRSTGIRSDFATDVETGAAYLRANNTAGEASDWQQLTTLGGAGGRNLGSRQALRDFLSAPGAAIATGTVLSDGILNYRFDAAAAVTTSAQSWYSAGEDWIPDLPGLVPHGGPMQSERAVMAEHFGYHADGTTGSEDLILRSWRYAQTLAGRRGLQNPPLEAVEYVFGNGIYRSANFLPLEASATCFTVRGIGPQTQLDQIGLHFRGAIESDIRDLRFVGAGDFGVKFSENARDGNVTGLFIRDRDVGILLDDATQTRFLNQEVFKCGIGLLVLKNSGCDFTNCQFTGAETFNIDVRAGGQLKMTNINAGAAGAAADNPKGAANMRLYGSIARDVVENYFTAVSLSHATWGARQYPILSIRDNGVGKIRVTTAEPHQLFPGYHDLWIKGTEQHEGQFQENSTKRLQHDVIAVLSPTVFDADIDYVADETFTGNEDGSQAAVWLQGWDLLVQSESSAKQVNDNFFYNCNINYTCLEAGYNLKLDVRLKEQIWFDDKHGDMNRILLPRIARGRSSDPTADTPISGPTSHRGWADTGFFDSGSGWEVNGGEHLALRMPHTASGVGVDSLPVHINAVSVYSDRVAVSVGGDALLMDRSAADQALKLTLPADGVVEALNAPKAWGRIAWDASVPTLSEGYNIASITSETDAEPGRVTVNFERDFASDDAPLPQTTAIGPNLDGVTVQATIVEAQRIKFEGKRAGADQEVDFAFVVYGRPA